MMIFALIVSLLIFSGTQDFLFIFIHLEVGIAVAIPTSRWMKITWFSKITGKYDI